MFARIILMQKFMLYIRILIGITCIPTVLFSIKRLGLLDLLLEVDAGGKLQAPAVLRRSALKGACWKLMLAGKIQAPAVLRWPALKGGLGFAVKDAASAVRPALKGVCWLLMDIIWLIHNQAVDAVELLILRHLESVAHAVLLRTVLCLLVV